MEQQLHMAQQALAAAYSLCPLTPRQYRVLASLAEKDGVSQTAIVAYTGVDRSTVASMVRQMAKRGLVGRHRSREDARANIRLRQLAATP